MGDVADNTDLDATVRIRRPVEAGAPRLASTAPVRNGAVDAAIGRADAAGLSSFLKEDSALYALRGWFGGNALELLQAGRRDAVVAALDRDICALDTLIADQVEAILHHPDFQRLEATWRGVEYLCSQAGEAEENVVIRLLDARWDELCRDFDRTGDFEQSQLFDKVYNQEFGMPGGKPFGLLVADYRVRHSRVAGSVADDVGGLRILSQVAAAAFAPVVIGAHPALFGLDSFAELGQPIDLAAIFRNPEYQRWTAFQESEDSRFIGVVLPGILMRPLYGDDGMRRDEFRFREGSDRPGHRSYLWGNGVYAFAAVVTRAYRSYGWFADIRGARLDGEDGGMVTGLSAPTFATDRWEAAQRRPVEAEITDAQEQALSNLGFISLSPCRNSPHLVFLGNQSLQRQPGDGGIAGVNARLGTMLQYMLCISRFSHYIKVISRDRLGSYMTAERLETYLDTWLRGYSLGNDDASQEQKARYPLRATSVQLKEIAGKPGALSCVFHLQPHFQLDQMVSGLRLRTELAAPQGA